MRWRSTLLIAIFVFGILFALIYVSSSSNIQALEERNVLAIEELQSTGTVYADIAAMTQPTDKICFSADQNFLEKFPSIAQGMREVDELAAVAYSRDNNYHASTGLNLDKMQVLSLLGGYQGYNITTASYTTPNNLFTYDQHGYSCNFAYNERYYRISIMFETLEVILRDAGYVPIYITEDSVAEKDEKSSSTLITFAPFNNTIVFYNKLSLPVTVQLASEDAIGLQPATIPSNEMRDFRLSVSWSTLENATYHYQVLEYPWIEGDIVASPKYTSECMDNKTAKSLYLHSGLDLKFPSYLPQGFASACNAEIFESHLVQIFVNQTAVDFYRENKIEHSSHNPYPFDLYGRPVPENEMKGIIQVHALRHYSEDPNEILQKDYERMLNDTSVGPEFFEIDSVAYLVFNQGSLSIVEIAIEQDQYRIVGMVPREEALRIAQSLF